MLSNSAGAPQLGVTNYSSPNSFVSDTQLLDTYLSGDIYLRIELNNGNLFYSLSTDGDTYFLVCQTPSNEFLADIDNVFYAISAENQVAPNIDNQVTIKSWDLVD